MKKLLFIFVFFSFFLNEAFCQKFFLSNLYKNVSVYLTGNYISSATIQLNPYSSDIIERNTTDEVKGGYGYGVSIKKKLWGDNFFISLSTEYLKISDNTLSTTLENDTSFVRVHVSETLSFIPIELAFYFNIPQSLENFNIFLGGGAGIYFGNRTRSMVGYETQTISKSPMINILVLFGMEYMLDKHLSMLFEMRVREGEYKVSNRFPVDNVTLDGVTYYFQQELNSKVFIDGLKLSFGLGYYF